MIPMPTSLDAQVHLVCFGTTGSVVPLGQMTLRESLSHIKRWKDAQDLAAGDSEQAKHARQWLDGGVWEFKTRVAGQEVVRVCVRVCIINGLIWQEVGVEPTERIAQATENAQKQQRAGDEWKSDEL